MPLPRVTLTATRTAGGAPASGWVELCLTAPVRLPAEGSAEMPTRIVGALDATGALSVVVTATEGPGIAGGATYRVVEHVGATTDTYEVVVPSTPATQALDSLPRVPAAPPAEPTATVEGVRGERVAWSVTAYAALPDGTPDTSSPILVAGVPRAQVRTVPGGALLATPTVTVRPDGATMDLVLTDVQTATLPVGVVWWDVVDDAAADDVVAQGTLTLAERVTR